VILNSNYMCCNNGYHKRLERLDEGKLLLLIESVYSERQGAYFEAQGAYCRAHSLRHKAHVFRRKAYILRRKAHTSRRIFRSAYLRRKAHIWGAHNLNKRVDNNG